MVTAGAFDELSTEAMTPPLLPKPETVARANSEWR